MAALCGQHQGRKIGLTSQLEVEFKVSNKDLWAKVVTTIHLMPRKVQSYPIKAAISAG